MGKSSIGNVFHTTHKGDAVIPRRGCVNDWGGNDQRIVRIRREEAATKAHDKSPVKKAVQVFGRPVYYLLIYTIGFGIGHGFYVDENVGTCAGKPAVINPNNHCVID